MTGTPTPGGVASEVRHLAPLLQILRHQPYGTNEALWRVRPSPIAPPAWRSPFCIGKTQETLRFRPSITDYSQRHAASCKFTAPLMQSLQKSVVDVTQSWLPPQEAIQRPFEARQREGRRRLMALLQETMVCASKAKLEAAGLLPTCKKQVWRAHSASSLLCYPHAQCQCTS